MSSIIQKIAIQAFKTFRFREENNLKMFKENICILTDLMRIITYEDFNISSNFIKGFSSEWSVINYEKEAPATYMEIWKCDLFTMSIFFLKKGAGLPLHDHPNMFGLIKVLHGQLNVNSYSSIESQQQSSQSSITSTVKDISSHTLSSKFNNNEQTYMDYLNKANIKKKPESFENKNLDISIFKNCKSIDFNKVPDKFTFKNTISNYQNKKETNIYSSDQFLWTFKDPPKDSKKLSNFNNIKSTDILKYNIQTVIPKDVNILVDHDSDVLFLTPDTGNFHKINSPDGPSVFFDILSPSYSDDKEIEPICSYYTTLNSEISINNLDDSQFESNEHVNGNSKDIISNVFNKSNLFTKTFNKSDDVVREKNKNDLKQELNEVDLVNYEIVSKSQDITNVHLDETYNLNNHTNDQLDTSKTKREENYNLNKTNPSKTARQEISTFNNYLKVFSEKKLKNHYENEIILNEVFNNENILKINNNENKNLHLNSNIIYLIEIHSPDYFWTESLIYNGPKISESLFKEIS